MSARLSSGGKGEVVGGVKVGVEVAVEARVLTEVGVVDGDPVVGLGLDAVLVLEVVGLVVVVVVFVVLLPWCSCQWARANAWRRLFDHGVGFFLLPLVCLPVGVLGSKTGKTLTGELLRTTSNEGSSFVIVTHLVFGWRERSE